jgi:HSP20 family protein
MLPTPRSRFATPLLESTFAEPWGELRREIDRLFDAVSVGNRPFTLENGSLTATWMPPMDVEEHDDLVRLTFEVPGVNAADLDVSVEHGMLTVSGEKKVARERTDGAKASRVVERGYGRFERSLALPQSVDADRVEARFHNGVLTVDLPKTAESRRRKIEIARGTEPKQLESNTSKGRSRAAA